MATTELTHTRPASAGERLQHLVEAAAARVASLWNAAKNRRSVARLLEWDDRMLSDIGLTQGDVRSALAARFSEDPSQHLGLFSGERRFAVRANARERIAQRRSSGLEI